MTIQTAVLIETLAALGAEVRWASCNIFSTQDHAAAAVVVGPEGTPEDPQGVPVFAWKGETLEEYWWCTDQALSWPDADGPEHDPRRRRRRDAAGPQGRRVRGRRRGARPVDGRVRGAPGDPGAAARARWPRIRSASPGWPRRIKGVTEETTTGVHRLYQFAEEGKLLFPAINVNDSVTKSKFDNKYGCRHSLIDGINRATDVLIGGKVARRVRLRRRRQGLRGVAARPGRAGDHHRDRPDLRAAGGDGRLPGGARSRTCSASADIFVTATGNKDVITAAHMAQMKHQAIVGNIGHFDNEIDMAGLATIDGIERINIKPQVDEWVFPNGQHDHRPVRGPAAEPRQRHRPPELRDVQLVHQPGDGPDRAVRQHRRVREAGLHAVQARSTRRSRGCISTRSASS